MIVYRSNKSNVVANALSRCGEDTVQAQLELNMISTPISSIFDKIRKAWDVDNEYWKLKSSILIGEVDNPNFTVRK